MKFMMGNTPVRSIIGSIEQADTQFVYLASIMYEDEEMTAIFSSQVDAAMWLGDQPGDGFVHTFLIDEPEWDYSNIN